MPWRSVSKETMQFYGVKTKIDNEGKPISLGFNYPNDAVKVRVLDEKKFYYVGDQTKSGLFGRQLFDPLAHKSVVITEGELDALSAYQMLGIPCVSISSASSGLRDCTGSFSWLRDFERIYLALDNDSPGRDAASRIARLFDYDKVYDFRLTTYKDANEYLQNGAVEAFRSIFHSARRYLPETIKSSLESFKTLLEAKQETGIPYPFPSLTEMTYGIRTGETVLVTAPEGVGKTEFLHAIEHSLLKRGERVGAFFLEEVPRRHLQSLGAISLKRPVHLPDSGCTDSEVMAAIRELVPEDDRLFLDTQFGDRGVEHLLGDIRFLVVGCGCRCILLDHISVAVGSLEGEDKRKALDTFFTRGETMVKELDFSLIVVSHVNDFGQTRDSRWGGKMADIRIDLSRDTDNGSNVMDVRVSKNRFSGRTGSAGGYEFNPITREYKYVEVEHGDL